MATRIHFKFYAVDDGRAIQNAAVYLYQPGTTTDFTGLAYDAKTVGSLKTNPLITNAQGEAEAYFDTPQSVDVKCTDNGGTAYYHDTPTSPFTFTAFTEPNYDLEPAREDQPTSIGLVGDITTITNAAQTALAGTTGRWTDAGHRHVKDASSANPHGVGDHTDVTRQFYLPAAIGTPQVGALASIGTYPNIIRVTTLADAVSTNGMFWHFDVPDDWTSGVLTIRPIWVPTVASVNGAVRWQYDTKELTAGTDVTAAGTTVAWTGDSAARTINQIVYDAATSTTLTPGAAGNAIRFAITRLGADALDTQNGVTVNLAGVLVTYTANQ